MRCGILSLLQESNTFLSQRTTFDDFAADVIARGEEVRRLFAGSPHEIGGFFAGLAREGIEAVPIFAARALPYGMIEGVAFEKLLSQMLDGFDAAGPLDGILAAAHGATVCENALDADGHWLSEVRRRIGPQIPLVGTIDPHANLSPAMIAACDALIAYRTNPHVDQRERGLEAAQLVARAMRREVRPTMAAAYPRLAMSIERQATEESPCQELCALADSLRRIPGVVTASIILGFPYADVDEMGCATIVVTDDDAELAEREAHTLAEAMWERRRQFVGERISVDEALRRARHAPAPVCLLDMGDNVGGGSPGDGTWIAHALLSRRVPRALAVLCDSEAVKAATQVGVGGCISQLLGGRSGPLNGAPLSGNFTVSKLVDGRFTESQPVHGGFAAFDQGPTAVLTTDAGPTLVVTSRRMAPFSLAQLTSCGLDPAEFHILAAKGVNAPIAAYSKVCRSFIRIDTPGYTAADMTKFPFERRRRPMFPFEPDCQWSIPSPVGREVHD